MTVNAKTIWIHAFLLGVFVGAYLSEIIPWVLR